MQWETIGYQFTTHTKREFGKLVNPNMRMEMAVYEVLRRLMYEMVDSILRMSLKKAKACGRSKLLVDFLPQSIQDVDIETLMGE